MATPKDPAKPDSVSAKTGKTEAAPEASVQSAGSLLILKSRKDTLMAPETFLKNRHWDVRSVATMKDALLEVMGTPPQYALLCADHPNKQVLNLPSILEAKLKVQVMAYFDKHVVNANPILEQMGCKYALYPPVSGPAIERMVLKIQRDIRLAQEKDAAEASGLGAKPGAGAGSQSDIINIKQGKQQSEADATQSGLADIQRMLKMEDGEGGQGGNDLIFMNRNVGDVMSEAGGGTEGPGGKNSTTDFSQREPGQRESGSGGSSSNGASGGTAETGGFGGSSGGTSRDARGTAIGPSNGAAASNAGSAANRDSMKTGGAGQSNGNGNGPITAAAASTTSEVPSNYPGTGEDESVLAVGVTAALAKSWENFYYGDVSRLVEGIRASCIVVDSQRFSGYLVIATKLNLTVGENYLRAFRDRLSKFMAEKGEQISEHEVFNIVLRPVNFQRLAEQKAAFIKSTVRKNDSVNVAFFPFAQIHIASEAIASDAQDARDLCAVSMEDLDGDSLLDFDLYLHLPKNNKFVHYSRRDLFFYSQQKRRLTEFGVDRMLLDGKEKENLIKYRARNFLNAHIDGMASSRRQSFG